AGLCLAVADCFRSHRDYRGHLSSVQGISARSDCCPHQELTMSVRSIVPNETVMMAVQAIRANKFRSVLTVLGIVVGVTYIVGVASLLIGVRSSIPSMVEG